MPVAYTCQDRVDGRRRQRVRISCRPCLSTMAAVLALCLAGAGPAYCAPDGNAAISATTGPEAATPNTVPHPLDARAGLEVGSKERCPFTFGLVRDRRGDLWIGSEDNGVWRFDPSTDTWRGYTTKDGLGDDNAYAILCDRLGRVWAGTRNHGVCVYNGRTWRTIDASNGLLGARVFALAECPTNGDIWIATEGGLTRYSTRGDAWSYRTTLDGLPSNPATCLAFDKAGNLYVGTAADGLAIGSAASDYQEWRVVGAPAGVMDLRPSAAGSGLPSPLINCLLVSRRGSVYAGTSLGLAVSEDGGRSWRYLRGADWRNKIFGLTHAKWPAPVVHDGKTLQEDFVSSLAEDPSGGIWVGHRQTALDLVDPHTLGPMPLTGWKTADLTDKWARCIVAEANSVTIGTYRDGIVTYRRLHPKPGGKTGSERSAAAEATPPLPVPASSPSLARMNTMLRVLSDVAPEPTRAAPRVVTLDDDWRTQGAWLGRYGRYWSCLCAMDEPRDLVWGTGSAPVDYKAALGSVHYEDDFTVRTWTQWKFTALPQALEIPPAALNKAVAAGETTWDKDRRQTEWDDHGEIYCMSTDGPHLFCTVAVPAGVFYLSLYEYNKDGHWGSDPFRDYRISIRPHAEHSRVRAATPDPTGQALLDVSGFDKQPELAHGRVRDYWGGVWKRFLVRGPITVTVKLDRNYSFNTNMNAVTLDLIDEDPPAYYHTAAEWVAIKMRQDKERQALAASWARSHRSVAAASAFAPAATPDAAAERCMQELDRLRLTNVDWWAANGPRFYTLLAPYFDGVVKEIGPEPRRRWAYGRLATCDYATCRFSGWETSLAAIGRRPTRAIELSMRGDNAPTTRAAADAATQKH